MGTKMFETVLLICCTVMILAGTIECQHKVFAFREHVASAGTTQDGQLNKSYYDYLEKRIPALRIGRKTRLILHIGNGGGNVDTTLEDRGALMLSITPPDNRAQLVAKGSHPGLSHNLSTHRLPYCSQAFELVQCSACDVAWHMSGGLLLLEADRVLRPGGYFVHSKKPSTQSGWTELARRARSVCWKVIVQEGGLAVWQKPIDRVCYGGSKASTVALCNRTSISPDAAWNVTLQYCLVGLSDEVEPVEEDWEMRMLNPPSRLKYAPAAGIESAKAEVYEADTNYWRMITTFYLRAFGPVRTKDVHNVIDMNAGYGGFAAALALQHPAVSWWVLSVIPVSGPDRLPVILDRGLLGIYHDWCEALDVHPFSFDMVHVSRLFSSSLSCTMTDVIREIHRILRPGGFVLVREHKDIILRIDDIAQTFHWKTHIDDTESGPMGKDKLLHCQKTFWQPQEKHT